MMNAWLMRAAVVSALVAGAPAAALAQEPTCAVTGVVRAPSGAPVAGASVSAGADRLAVTDADGRFTLQLARGQYELRRPSRSPVLPPASRS
jgi:hypothetical protein